MSLRSRPGMASVWPSPRTAVHGTLKSEYVMPLSESKFYESTRRNLSETSNGVNTHGTRFPQGAQRKFDPSLTKRYSLSKPGPYSIVLRRRVPKLDGIGWTEVASEN